MEKIVQNAKTVCIGNGFKKEEIEPPSNFDIIKLVKNHKMKHFRDVFMKYELPQKVNNTECGIKIYIPLMKAEAIGLLIIKIKKKVLF